MAASVQKLGGEEGFEPSIQFPVCRLSKAVPSATRPPLHKVDRVGSPDRVEDYSIVRRRWRRRRDSNPRRFRATVFKTVAFDRSATPPLALAREAEVVMPHNVACQADLPSRRHAKLTSLPSGQP